MKRKYIKRNCNYWGHNADFIYTAIDSDTKKIIAYYGICKRCNKKIFLQTNGKVNNAALTHLAAITLKDLPLSDILKSNCNYKFMDVYKK